MDLYTLPNGIISTNSYILSDGLECVVIDCGVKTEDILRVIKEHGLHLKYIILTHGHFDHIYHVKSLKEATGALICLHEAELDVYQDPQKNGALYFGLLEGFHTVPPDILLKDGQILQAGTLRLDILHTPGHSPGSICIHCGGYLFSGDTLFLLSVGRTDLVGGSQKALIDAITKKIFVLDDTITVYPGHGPKTTIGYERENNPYVQE